MLLSESGQALDTTRHPAVNPFARCVLLTNAFVDLSTQLD